MATLLPEGKQSFTTSAGAPLAGGKVYTYDAGTSTPRPTYADAAGITPNANPVILDARGEAAIFFSGAYKVILKDSTDATIWTVDGLVGLEASDLTNTASATKGAGMVGFAYANAYPLNTIGGWIKARLDVSVKDFGATGDGSTNDSAAIAAACAALTPGRTLYFPPGNYLVSATVLDAAVVLPADTNLFMERGAWLKAGSTFGTILAPLGRNVITCNIDGNGYPSSGGVAGTWTNENAGIKCYFGASTGLSASDVVVCNSEIKNCTYGIFPQGAQRWRVYGNKIHRVKQCAMLWGFYAGNDCAYNIISNNFFEDCGDYAVAFFQVGGYSSGFGVYNTISNNIAKDCNQRTNGYAYGVEAGDAAYQRNFLFIGNQYIDTVTGGAFGHGGIVMNTCTDSAAIDNVMYGSLGSAADVGVVALMSVGCVVRGNTITRFRGGGVITDGSVDCVVRSNKIKNSGSNSPSYAPIVISLNESTSGVRVVGNDIAWDDSYTYTGAGSVGINAAVASGKIVSRIIVEDNVLYNPPQIGIRAVGLSGNTLARLTIKHNTMSKAGLFASAGLSLDWCSELVVEDNSIRDAGIASTMTNCAGRVVKRNVGYVTENEGVTAAIATGATVAHGLVSAPVSVFVTPAETGVTDVTVSAIGATTFVVNFGGGGGKVFSWNARGAT